MNKLLLLILFVSVCFVLPAQVLRPKYDASSITTHNLNLDTSSFVLGVNSDRIIKTNVLDGSFYIEDTLSFMFGRTKFIKTNVSNRDTVNYNTYTIDQDSEGSISPSYHFFATRNQTNILNSYKANNLAYRTYYNTIDDDNDSIIGSVYISQNAYTKAGGYSYAIRSQWNNIRVAPTRNCSVGSIMDKQSFVSLSPSIASLTLDVSEIKNTELSMRIGNYSTTNVSEAVGLDVLSEVNARSGGNTSVTTFYLIRGELTTSQNAGTRLITASYGLYLSNKSGVYGSVVNHGIFENFGPNLFSSQTTVDNDFIVSGSINQAYLSGSLTDDAPTAAEIGAITGKTPAEAGNGFSVKIKDTDGSQAVYYIYSDGTNYNYVKLIISL